jgi:transaldolase
MKRVEDLSIKIFADGADKAGMLDMYSKPYIKGFTTNPTLMRKAGISDYKAFALDILTSIKDKPISFEVFSDDFKEMMRQALVIKGWAENVYVKIPVTNTEGFPSYDLINDLVEMGAHLNVTAITTLKQISEVSTALENHSSYVSVFAGRIANTGIDPVPIMTEAVEIISVFPKQELLWASPRELLNIFQADEIGCQVITVTNDILNKLELVGKDLSEYSLDTVKMFRSDAMKAGYDL